MTTSFTDGQTDAIAELITAPSDDPNAVADRFVEKRRRAVSEEVGAIAELAENITRIADDNGELSRLLDVLAARKVLSAADLQVRASGERTKISMWRKIGRHASVLMDPRILPFIEPGYSVLYQLICLYEELEKQDELN